MTERTVAIIKEVLPSHLTFYFQVGAAPHDVAVHSMERWVPVLKKRRVCLSARLTYLSRIINEAN